MTDECDKKRGEGLPFHTLKAYRGSSDRAAVLPNLEANGEQYR
jgi:hypothetical protein